MRYIARVTSRFQFFSGSFIDRRAELRDDPDWLRAARTDPETRYVLAAGPTQLVLSGAAGVALLRYPLVWMLLGMGCLACLFAWFRLVAKGTDVA